jgi:ADP-heptose:LPS heptosyltransferase
MNSAATRQNGESAAWQSRAAAAMLMMYRRRRLMIRVADALLRPLAWLSRSGPAPKLDQVKSILVFEPANLGDIVTLAPFLRSLRARFPQARLAFVGKSSTESFLREQELADELIPIRVPWAEHVSRWRRYNPFSPLWPSFAWSLILLRKRHFDLAFANGRSDIRHNLALWLTGARRRVGYGYAGGSFLLTDVVLPDLGHPHVTDLTLQFLKHLNIPTVHDGSLLRVSAGDQEFADKILTERGAGPNDLLVGIHAGARKQARQWGEDRFRQVALQIVERFGGKIIWFADPAQPHAVSTGPNIIPVSLPLRQFLAVLSRCRLLVCNDSGPMHMAGGLGVPVVAVFGPTQPEWFGPLGSQHRVVIRGDVWCRPCADHCLFKEPYCLRLIPVEQVMEAVAQVMESLSLASASAF